MGIQSLGVGSGLALDDLVNKLIQAEREPKEKRFKAREESIEAQISGLGSVKSKLAEFKKTLDGLKNDFSLSSRKPSIEFPTALKEGETGAFEAEASSSAIQGKYKVAITQLAQGTQYKTADSDFANTSAVVSDAAGTVSFRFSGASDSFSINVTNGMTLQQYVDAINSSKDNLQSDKKKPLVVATLVNTGTSAGPKVIFRSNLTGAGTELRIINDNNIAGLNKLTSETSSGTNNALNTNSGANAKVLSRNAMADVDGIKVESKTNKFENVIPNVSFTAKELSEKTSDGSSFKTATLEIGNNTQDMDKKVRDFVENFNKVVSELKKLTKNGESKLEKDGALSGDFMIRGLQFGLSNLVSDKVAGNPLGTLFQLGITLDKDGALEITKENKFGLGTGDKRLKDALENNFDDVVKLFSDKTNGIGKKLFEYVDQFSRTGGILSQRERSVKAEKDALDKERQRFELQMANFESSQRKKYVALDRTVSSLKMTQNALLASLPSPVKR